MGSVDWPPPAYPHFPPSVFPKPHRLRFGFFKPPSLLPLQDLCLCSALCLNTSPGVPLAGSFPSLNLNVPAVARSSLIPLPTVPSPSHAVFIALCYYLASSHSLSGTALSPQLDSVPLGQESDDFVHCCVSGAWCKPGT